MAITGKSNLPSQKTQELIVYIASNLKDKPNYGSVLLNKALYHIDGVSYIVRGRPVSEFEYIKQGKGPTPKPAQFLAARDYLEANNKIERIEEKYYTYTQIKYISNEKPKVDLFEKEELELINNVLLHIGELSAASASDDTHRMIAWKLAKPMEALPLYTYLLGSAEPALKDYEWAESAIQRFENATA